MTMGYKHEILDHTPIAKALEMPNFLLKTIPHVDGTPRICELVEYHLEDYVVKGAWSGPASLQLFDHVRRCQPPAGARSAFGRAFRNRRDAWPGQGCA
jgi:acetoacetate decarboxylase